MVFAIDFDGTLVTQRYPEIGDPNWSIVNKAKELQAAGHIIVLWTCRSDKYLKAAVDYCEKVLDLHFDYINESSAEHLLMYDDLNPRKIGADFYIDDRNLSLTDFIAYEVN